MWEVRLTGLPFFCLCLFFLFYYSISSKYVIYYPLCCIKIILNVILHILNKKFEKQKKRKICIRLHLKIGVCACVCGGGGGFVDISCRNQIQARFGKAVS